MCINFFNEKKEKFQHLNIGSYSVGFQKYKPLKYFFFVGIWSWLADKLHFILSYEAGFYKPTVLKFHPPFFRITAFATMPG
jgi:hypothetical protein